MSADASSPRRRRSKAFGRAASPPRHALLVIDHEQLQRAAWAEFQIIRHRLDRAARELHRHEEIDVPAYDAWLHRTFPLQVTALRELNDQIIAKARQIRDVQVRAMRTGRSLKRLWQEEKERTANPEAFRAKARERPEPKFEEDEQEGAGPRRDARPEDFVGRKAPPRSDAARDVYRRLVQNLHPDRGGAWTPERQQLWHEVQQAWAAGDADWLARLEVEWETAHHVVGPTSPLSRLRAAIEELHAAQRDLENKLQDYRTSLPWRFTLAKARRATLERRVEAELARDYRHLIYELKQLNAMIADWEEDWTRASSRPQRKSQRPGFQRRPRRSAARTKDDRGRKAEDR